MISLKRIFSIFVPVIIFTTSLLAFYFRQEVYDWWRIGQYEASPAITRIVNNTAMSGDAVKLFYVTHPRVVDSDEFNQNCSIGEFSIILGCYVHQGLVSNIYIFNVTDKRLSGIQEVTAAHEMLHSAYERLGNSEKEEINAQLLDYLKNTKNQRLLDTIKEYENHDPAIVPNELHSILGTEIADLPDELEQYYGRYFTDRSKVVKYAQDYEQEFSSRQKRVEEIDKELANLKSKIDSNLANLDSLEAELNAKRAHMNSLRAQGKISEYNSEVDNYNALVNEYNSLVSVIESQISQYNALAAERNSLIVEVRGLVEAIDSSPEKIR